MLLILAKPRGFCAGVHRAIESLTIVSERFQRPIYVYHEIVHNTWVVSHFRDKGVRFVESLGEVPEGSVLMFSAHGVSPIIREEAKKRSLTVIDATCPLVERVHQEVRRYAKQGFQIIYIGHPGHDEVLGTISESPEQITLISSENEVECLSFPMETKLAVLMQTTLSVDETAKMVEKLKFRFPTIETPHAGNICYATQNRQEAIRKLAAVTDIAIVVGSSNSSNSRRLQELAQIQGIPSHLIDRAEEIDLKWFDGKEKVLITAGASAPEHLLLECVDRLKDAFHATVEERIICQERLQFSLPDIGRLI